MRTGSTFKTRLLLLLALVACGEGAVTGLSDRGDATVAFDVRGAKVVRSVAIEVSGPGIDSLLVFNIAIDSNGAGADTARVPAGAGRRFVARAFDVTGISTHRGDTTVTLVEGANPRFSLVLRPLIGGLPITLTFGGVGLTLTPGDTTISVGTSLQYTAGGVDSLGSAIPPAAVVWSSSDQTVVLVTSLGIARARAVGSAYVLATYQGATLGRKLTVTP